MTYKLDGYPKIHCLDPNLAELAAGRRLPHVYSREHPISLCLFFRNERNWNDQKLLADAVMPLAYGWLAYFEDWLFSGIWRGTGTHPMPEQPPEELPFTDEFVTTGC